MTSYEGKPLEPTDPTDDSGTPKDPLVAMPATFLGGRKPRMPFGWIHEDDFPYRHKDDRVLPEYTFDKPLSDIGAPRLDLPADFAGLMDLIRQNRHRWSLEGDAEAMAFPEASTPLPGVDLSGDVAQLLTRKPGVGNLFRDELGTPYSSYLSSDSEQYPVNEERYSQPPYDETLNGLPPLPPTEQQTFEG